MPIYGYRCASCGHELEVLQSMRDAPLTVCDDCGGRLEKKLYPVGVQFKGSGFYSTDYKRSARKDADGSDGKSDSKPDGKKESAAASSTSEAKGSKPASGEKATSKAAES